MNFLKSAKNLASKLFTAPLTNSSKTEALPPETVEPQQTAPETFPEPAVCSNALILHPEAQPEPEPVISPEEVSTLEAQIQIKEQKIHAVYYQQNYVPKRIRLFIDFLAEKLKAYL